jgi:type VI secretion system secreted protein VgrG
MPKQKITFGIDKKEIPHFISIELNQTINNHHRFKICVPHSVIEKPRAYTIENAQEWLGKVVHIVLENNNNFLGIITNIQFAQEQDHVGNQIILSGFSKTILLESGKKMHSWEDTTLQDMVQEVIKTAAGEQLQNDIQPENTTRIEYQTQHLETDFQYIQRLAKQYNEWLLYDGEKLFFGKPKKQEEAINLTYSKDIHNLNISIQAIPNQFSAFTYNENTNNLYQAKTQDKIEGLPKLGNEAFEASEKLYSTPSFEYGRIATGYDMALETSLKKRQESIMADANYITASSHNNQLKIGSIIHIDALQVKNQIAHLSTLKDELEAQEVGQYIITEITHKATDIGEYSNHFKALPAFIKKLPEPQIDFPQAQIQQAIVVDNADPKGNGRIRVQLLWQQTKNLCTPWLRVMTPDAGTSTEVATNRGMVFIPEVGDHVLLGFRYNDPNRPFVMGSLFNGTTAKGGGANNDLRSIYDGSGHRLELEKERNITLGDIKENKFHIDSTGNNINVNALETVTIHAKNVVINASNNIVLNAGNNLEMNISKELIMDVKRKIFTFTPALEQVVSGFMSLFSAKALINSSHAISIEAKEVTTHGTEKMLVHSDKLTSINSKEVAEMHGKTKNSFTNAPLAVALAPPKNLTNVIVEFRTKQDGTYTGQFGFDWLRIDDNGLTNEKKYEDCLVNGYEKPNGKIVNPTTKKITYTDSNTEYEAGEAFPALEKMYNQLPISRTSTPKLTQYYVPWLNLYPKAVSDAIITTPKPAYEAELRVLIDVEIEEPDQVRLVFDKRYFTIDNKDGTDANPVLLTNKTLGAKREAGTINIKCIREFGTDQEIKVYAYPKDSLLETTAKQLTLRRLAGKIIVCANLNRPKNGKIKAVTNRKTQKFVLVQVKTNLTGTGETGNFDPAEKINLQNALHQALIHGEVEEFVAKDIHGNPLLDSAGAIIDYLDLSTNANFQIAGKYITGGLIVRTESTLNSYMRQLLSQSTTSLYTDYFYVFVFGIPESTQNVAGRVEGIGKKSVVLYPGRDNYTLNHEVLHGLGLYHTHADGTITDSEQKFVFVHAKTDPYSATDNIMSYQPDGKTTWKWQWEIIKKYIK